MIRAPLVVSFAGVCWPCGPEPVRLRVTPREGSRCRLRAGDHVLLVDPSLPAPADDEGPLGAEAAVLRAAPPANALDLVAEGPRPPHPGADLAILAALRMALGQPASEGDATARAIEHGVPVDAVSGDPAPVSPELLAWCEASLLLARDSVGAQHPDAGTAAPGLLEAASPDAWAQSVAGQGLDAPLNQREAAVFAALRAAGLLARWPLGGSACLMLSEATAREALVASLSDHGFEVWPLVLSGIKGLCAENEPA